MSLAKMKHFAAQLPRLNTKFVAFYHDGSGAEIFKKIDKSTYIDCNGEKYNNEHLMDNFFYWLQIPTEFEFFYEVGEALKGEENDGSK